MGRLSDTAGLVTNFEVLQEIEVRLATLLAPFPVLTSCSLEVPAVSAAEGPREQDSLKLAPASCLTVHVRLVVLGEDRLAAQTAARKTPQAWGASATEAGADITNGDRGQGASLSPGELRLPDG